MINECTRGERTYNDASLKDYVREIKKNQKFVHRKRRKRSKLVRVHSGVGDGSCSKKVLIVAVISVVCLSTYVPLIHNSSKKYLFESIQFTLEASKVQQELGCSKARRYVGLKLQVRRSSQERI